MALMKIFLIGAIVSGLLGIGAVAIKEGAEAVDDISDNWGFGRGGCHGGSSYYEKGDRQFSNCHEEYYFESEDGYCPFHDEYFSEEEWEEHTPYCPMYD
ncbi:MAG: hypothetical protein ACMUIE_10370 [Thermoplasmatota archaeon]